MRTYMVIIASIAMLATTVAFGRDQAASPAGVGQTAAYGYAADNGIQTTWAAQYGMDQKTPSAMQTSATTSAPVALIVDRGGSAMHRHGGSFSHPSRGHSFHSRPFGDRFSHRDHFFHRDHFLHRDRFFHGGFGYYPYGRYYYYPYRYYYPYGYFYSYGNPWYFYPYPYFYFSW